MGSVFVSGQSPDSFIYIGGIVCRFPRVLCLCGHVEIFPLVRGLRVHARFQHRICCDEEEGRVRDQVITRAAFGFLLGVLKCVYVLKDDFAVRVVLLHLVLERKYVYCVHSAAD